MNGFDFIFSFIAARAMAKKGAHVVMLNRRSNDFVERCHAHQPDIKSSRSDRSEAAFKTIRDEFPEAKVTAIDCDLMDFASVKKAAEAIKQQFPDGIDVLCNNAGIMADEDKATKDGTDSGFEDFF
jgi:NAD(P)-dependent dehydrogenase (short-subunit alcohol dehydrogenase family)